MKIKKMAGLMALVLSMGAFSMPLAVHAGGDTTPPTVTAALDGGTLDIEAEDDNSGVEAVYIGGMRVSSLVDGKASVEFKDYAEGRESVGIYAVDYAGNRSDTVTVENPFYEEPSWRTFRKRTGRHRRSPGRPLPLTGPARCWMRLTAGRTISSSIPSPPKRGTCSTW